MLGGGEGCKLWWTFLKLFADGGHTDFYYLFYLYIYLFALFILLGGGGAETETERQKGGI